MESLIAFIVGLVVGLAVAVIAWTFCKIGRTQ